MKILQVSSADEEGGAESVARQLFGEYARRGHRSWLAVGRRHTDADGVFLLDSAAERGSWARHARSFGDAAHAFTRDVPVVRRLTRPLPLVLGQPRRWLDIARGREDFAFPATWRLLELVPEVPDVIHCHNLHGPGAEPTGYFDLRALPWLAARRPVVLTLHDAWLLSGHCAHSFECERWRDGCGKCPDLSIYPAIRRDATAFNWRRKQAVFGQSRLYVAAPSDWLLTRARQSILGAGIVESRLIPNGVELDVFRPRHDRDVTRAALGLSADTNIVLFAANGGRRNQWRDFGLLRTAVAAVSERVPNLACVVVGDDGPDEQVGVAQVVSVPFTTDREAFARLFAAADVYAHPARAETFGKVVAEALACGTPVVATAVGGVPELVKGLGGAGPAHLNDHPLETATGVLTPSGDADAFGAALERLLLDDSCRRRLSDNATRDAAARFDLNRQADEYLDWYAEIAERDWSLDEAGNSASTRDPDRRPRLAQMTSAKLRSVRWK